MTTTPIWDNEAREKAKAYVKECRGKSDEQLAMGAVILTIGVDYTVQLAVLSVAIVMLLRYAMELEDELATRSVSC